MKLLIASLIISAFSYPLYAAQITGYGSSCGAAYKNAKARAQRECYRLGSRRSVPQRYRGSRCTDVTETESFFSHEYELRYTCQRERA